jgi:hypothetical protein
MAATGHLDALQDNVGALRDHLAHWEGGTGDPDAAAAAAAAITAAWADLAAISDQLRVQVCQAETRLLCQPLTGRGVRAADPVHDQRTGRGGVH